MFAVNVLKCVKRFNSPVCICVCVCVTIFDVLSAGITVVLIVWFYREFDKLHL